MSSAGYKSAQGVYATKAEGYADITSDYSSMIVPSNGATLRSL